MCCCCCCDCCDCILAILAFICPPIPVAIKRGLCSADFFINIALCLLGWVPGLIHAWYIILTNPQEFPDDIERQIYVVAPPGGQQVINIQQPAGSTVTFNHPEPFLESQNNRKLSVPAAIQDGRVSPLTESPKTINQAPASYGAIGDVGASAGAPPSYDTVMTEDGLVSPQPIAPDAKK